MRIGIDGRSLLETEPSGVSIYTVELLQALAHLPDVAAHHSLQLFVSGAHFPGERLAWLKALPNTTVHHLPWPNKLFHVAALAGLAPKLDAVCGGVDVLFAPNWNMLPLTPAVPLVLTVHDVSYALYPQFLSWRRKLWHVAVRPGAVLQRAKKIIAVSQATATSLLAASGLSAHPDKITVIHSGVPTEPAAENLPNLPKHFVVCVGTLEPRKNLASVLTAFQQYRVEQPDSQLQLVLLGARGWRSGWVQRQVQTNTAVHYFGYVSPGQKRFALQQAAALLYPSIYEGFGFPPLEALSLGTPVIASAAGALPEVLGRSAWYCNPYATGELITLLQTIDQKPKLQPSYYRADWQKLNWQATAAATLRVLEQAVY